MPDEIAEHATRAWATKERDSHMSCYLGMNGRVSLGELISHFEQHYPHVDPMSVRLNYATAQWLEPPTIDDLNRRNANERWAAERLEKWEQETYKRLKAKFETTKR